MKNRFVLFFFILSIAFTNCSECTEKTDVHDSAICEGLETSSSEKNCVIDIYEEKCVEKECSDFEIDNCHNFIPPEGKACAPIDEQCQLKNCVELPGKFCYYVPVSSSGERCMEKLDYSGCEYISCEDLTEKCYRFYFETRDSKCVLNKSKNRCEVRKCSDLTENCGQFSPNSGYEKCAFEAETNKCKIVNKECSEFNSDECGTYYSEVEDESCVPDGNKCKLVKCSELSSSECDKYVNYYENNICAPSSTGDNCALQNCENLSLDVCENIKFYYPYYKCVISEDNCALSRCSDLTTNCGNYITSNPLYKCTESDDGRCEMRYKECEEMDVDKCNLYDDKDGRECIYSEKADSCVLNYSKNIELNMLIIFVLSLLL